MSDPAQLPGHLNKELSPASRAGKNMIKGLLAGALGLLIRTVGEDEAAGMAPCTTVPSGAMISSGRNMPAVFGTSASRSTERTHSPTTEAVKESVLLRAPRT